MREGNPPLLAVTEWGALSEASKAFECVGCATVKVATTLWVDASEGVGCVDSLPTPLAVAGEEADTASTPVALDTAVPLPPCAALDDGLQLPDWEATEGVAMGVRLPAALAVLLPVANAVTQAVGVPSTLSLAAAPEGVEASVPAEEPVAKAEPASLVDGDPVALSTLVAKGVRVIAALTLVEAE